VANRKTAAIKFDQPQPSIVVPSARWWEPAVPQARTSRR